MSKSNQNRLNELLLALSSEISNEAEDAQFCIQEEFGIQAIEPVLKIFPNLSDFPRRCALDFISDCITEKSSPVLKDIIEKTIIPCLALEDQVSRAWTAEILKIVGTDKSIAPLTKAMTRLKAEKIPPDWHEPVAIRSALRKLGAFQRKCPIAVRDSAICDRHFNESWSLSGIVKVLEALINEKQAVICFQVWRYKENSYYWAQANRQSKDLDFSLSWQAVVNSSFENALKIVNKIKISKNHRATFDWISEADL